MRRRGGLGHLVKQLAQHLVARARQRRDQVGGVVERPAGPERGREDGRQDEEAEKRGLSSSFVVDVK